MNIDFPWRYDSRGLTAACERDQHIRNLIEQFLFANPGERVNRPDFGSGLLQMVFAPNSPELAAAVQYTIQAGLQRWLADLVELRALEVQSEGDSLQVLVAYAVRSTGDERVERFVRRAI